MFKNISFTKDEYTNLPRDICNFSKPFKARFKLFLQPLLLSATFSPWQTLVAFPVNH